MTEETKNHISAADVLVVAAKKSGFLDQLAGVLRFIDSHRDEPPGSSMMCVLYENLAELFDDNICLPESVIEIFYGEGVGIGPFIRAELAP